MKQKLQRAVVIAVLSALAALVLLGFMSTHSYLRVFGWCIIGITVGHCLFVTYNVIESVVVLCIWLALLSALTPVLKKRKHPEIPPICLTSLLGGFIASRIIRTRFEK